MKFRFAILLLFAVNLTIAQDSFSKKEAQAIVDTFFEGFHQGDTLKMKSVMLTEVPMQTVFSTADGEDRIVTNSADNFLVAIANRPEEQKWDERLLDYKVQIDGNLAHVWTPYEFWLNGTFSHCGANAFTIGKTDDGWKIIHIIDSRRKGSCGK